MAPLTKAPQFRDYLMGEFLDSDIAATLKRNMQPFQQLMAQHRCAIMEIETKFKVLNEEFSYRHDRNPIETIKTRLKSPESIARKLKKNRLPFTAFIVVRRKVLLRWKIHGSWQEVFWEIF